MANAVFLFLLGLIFLIKGGDWFVDGACEIAKRFRMPELLIGATVVSIGTTLPEVMVSATGALGGLGSMAYGNAVGSIICNTALISALTIAVMPTTVDKKGLILPVSFFFGAAAVFAAISYTTGFFSRTVGIVFLVLFVVYIAINILSAVKAAKAPAPSLPEAAEEPEEGEGNGSSFGKGLIFFGIAVLLLLGGILTGNFQVFSLVLVVMMLLTECLLLFFGKNEKIGKSPVFTLLLDFYLLIFGAAAITNGADLLVNNGTIIAEVLGVPNSVIALTFVALGTSLPELVTAITSLVKGHGALSLGNVIGANLFNIVLVCGVSVTLNPFAVPTEKVLLGMNSSLLLEIPLALTVMLLLTLPPLLKKGKLYRWQGISLLALYAGFLVLQFAV